MMRTTRLTMTGLLVLAVATGCFPWSNSPEDTVNRFTEALTRADVDAAAAETSDPASAKAALQSMFDGMGSKATLAATPKLDDKDATGTVDYSWTIRESRTVGYQTTVTLQKGAGDWKVQWAPTLLHPQLSAGRTLSYSDDMDYSTRVLDRNGQPIMNWQPVTLVSLNRADLASAARLARTLRVVEPTMTEAGIRKQFESSPADVQTVIRLRDSDFAKIKRQLTGITGVTTTNQGALLSATKDLHSPAMSGLEDVWRSAIGATAGWSVSIVDGNNVPTDVIKQVAPQPTEPIRTGLDRDIQSHAQRAVDTERRPAVVVAIAPSTGQIVAVAQNSAADRSGAIALSGLYPPGSTFKTITTAAGLESGVVESDTRLPCPGRTTVEGRTIPNENDFDLGTVPLATAFAQSCNTTMGALANRLPADALPTTARQFGIGVDYVIPGVTTVTGTVSDASSPALRVENGIGQGTVAVSPFGLAVAEASLARGATITPTLIVGKQTSANTALQRIPTEVTRQLGAMMRQTVTSGTATALRDIPGLGGKTGTAEYGDNTNPHGWFAGIVGDLAFATLVVGGGSSAPAVRVTGDFLQPLVDG
ncbi:penicillin-binding transpeptidase domain-containing protein [Gordonia sp. CPCC 205515]|uniref:penicillin-binding transpeptidase domain-containing protein n=1 Tax=Gordonia sp. CPCC 205515 TaxID=3140791 RepID=UPI003AF3A67E